MRNLKILFKMEFNVLRLCVRLRSVGIERLGGLHKTAVIRWHGWFSRNL